jgi:hypothetical protein
MDSNPLKAGKTSAVLGLSSSTAKAHAVSVNKGLIRNSQQRHLKYVSTLLIKDGYGIEYLHSHYHPLRSVL